MIDYWFKDEGYWAGNGCDCCEPTYFECYNYIGLDEHDFLDERSSDIPYSCQDEISMMVAVLVHYYQYDEYPLWALEENKEGSVEQLLYKHNARIMIDEE